MTHRFFFAIKISEPLSSTIAAVISPLKNQSAYSQIRWSPPENWHVTLRFLGQVEGEKIDTCIERAKNALQSIPAFEIKLGLLTVFSIAHSHALVIQVPLSSALHTAHHALEKTMIAIGFKSEPHAFSPHITLGKFQQPCHRTSDFLADLKKITMPAYKNQLVKEIALFQSETKAGGSIYRLIHQIPLNPHKYS